MNTSAPSSASPGPPVTPRGLLRCGQLGLLAGRVGGDVRAVAVDDAAGVQQDDVARSRRSSRISATAMPAAPAPETTTRRLSSVAAGHLGGVGQGGEDHDGGAVLVIVHDRAVQGLDELLLEFEAARGGDVLEVDGAEAGAQPDKGLDDLVDVGGVEDQRDGVELAEGLEQGGLALHHGQRGAGADVAQAQHGRAVADHHHEALGPGEGLGELRVGVDGAADLGDTGRVGDGKVALAGERDGAGDRQLAALVGCEDFLVAEQRLLAQRGKWNRWE